VIAIDMSSIIPGWRSRSSATAPARNGHPPHTNTIESRTGASTSIPGKSREYPNQSITISLVTTNGIVNERQTQNRRRNISGS
jgi:hypothetical protein